MPNCFYCSAKLLRHIRQGKLYWHCLDCRQAMPSFEEAAHSFTQYTKRQVISHPVHSQNVRS